MIKQVIQLTCNGCGSTTFMETYNSELIKTLQHYKDGSEVGAYSNNQSESWSRIHTHMDLCPRCQKIHEKMLCKFYEECGGARDDEQT